MSDAIAAVIVDSYILGFSVYHGKSGTVGRTIWGTKALAWSHRNDGDKHAPCKCRWPRQQATIVSSHGLWTAWGSMVCERCGLIFCPSSPREVKR